MKNTNNIRNDLQIAREVLMLESQALQQQISLLDEQFIQAVDIILQCQGRIVLCGIGKSGHVAGKIAATMASTGTPAFFVHPAEAAHGDLGMILAQDIVIALSQSGESEEILAILPALKRKGVPIIAITGRKNSTLAKQSNIHLYCQTEKEACPLGLAPTSSTTLSMALGDALAVALLKARQFTADDFALSHPSGSLGKRLLVSVADLMHSGQDLPLVSKQTSLRDAIITMSEKGLGLCTVAQNGQLVGIFTDGDLRRLFQKTDHIANLTMQDVMTHNPQTIQSDRLASEALHLMQQKRINALAVEEKNSLVGAINMHDLLRTGIF